jgi:hypothetical protein
MPDQKINEKVPKEQLNIQDRQMDNLSAFYVDLDPFEVKMRQIITRPRPRPKRRRGEGQRKTKRLGKIGSVYLDVRTEARQILFHR